MAVATYSTHQPLSLHRILPSSTVQCSYCGANADAGLSTFLKCAGCQTAWYCRSSHQKYDWKRHKFRCKVIQDESCHKSGRERKISGNLSEIQKKSVTFKLINGSEPQEESQSDPSDPHPTPPDPVAFETPQSSTSDNMKKSISESIIQPMTRTKSPNKPVSSLKRTKTSMDFRKTAPTLAEVEDSSSTSHFTFLRPASPAPRPGTPPCKYYLGPCPEPPETKDHSKNKPYSVSLYDHLQSCATAAMMRGSSMTQYQAFCLRVRDMSSHIINSLCEFGWAVVDNFLGDAHALAIEREVCALYNAGLFAWRREEHDSFNQVLWFDNRDEETTEAVNIGFLISMIDSLMIQLGDQIPHSISGRAPALLSCYPGNGCKSEKAVENSLKDGRCVSVTYFSNRDWKNKDGGILRLFPETSDAPVDVEPLFDRLVVHWTNSRVATQVLPTNTHRFSVIVWYFDSKEKAEANRTLQLEKQLEVQAQSTEMSTDFYQTLGKLPHWSPPPATLSPPTSMHQSSSAHSLQQTDIITSKSVNVQKVQRQSSFEPFESARRRAVSFSAYGAGGPFQPKRKNSATLRFQPSGQMYPPPVLPSNFVSPRESSAFSQRMATGMALQWSEQSYGLTLPTVSSEARI